MAEPKIKLIWKKIDELIPYEHNAKLHPQEQIDKLVGSFDEFGRIVPAGIDRDGHLIYGHGRILAARRHGLPVYRDRRAERDAAAGLCARRQPARRDRHGRRDPARRDAGTEVAGFDVAITGFDPAGIQLGEDEDPEHFWGDVDAETTDKYEEFVEKFKHKLTTDDVYTPENIYNVVLRWTINHYELGNSEIVRPFYPGGDYQSFDYPADCVVIDNPPFSILSQICAWYDEHGIRYLLFAPGLTLFSTGAGACNYLPVGPSLMYSNGATIATSFVTNMGAWKIELCPELYKALDEANAENLRAQHADLPVYSYPDYVANVTMNRLCKYGQAIRIPATDASFIRALDAQKEAGKAIYGGGFLLSEKAAAEKAAAEKAAALKWQLSDREREIIAKLGAEAAT